PAMTMRGRQLPSNDSFISPRILGRNRAGHENGGPPDGFVFLDGDDWLAPHALSRLADALQAAPWAVAACGRYARVSPNGSVHLAPRPAHGCLLERLLTRNLFANGGHLLIRREAVETAGPFRHDLSYGEDWEYWTRLALLGEFVSIPSPEPPVLILMKRWCQPLSSWRAKARHPRLLAFRANGGTDGGLSPPTTGKVIAASHRIMRTGSPEPILFVRERPGSALFAGGTDPAANRPALEAIYQNPAIAIRIGRIRLGDLSQRARAETAWAVGRELIRHGRQRDGWRWLRRSIQAAPNVRRLALIGLAWLRCGPFRPYRTARVSLFRQYRHCD
ncbi:MAG TPA: hypothetical protein DDZ81_03030, partial [Acetobacteraceae bacterium]|nr:hypothetical protein [Acetobacteraceae bacterium]